VFTVGSSPVAALKAAVMVEDIAATVFAARQLGRVDELPPAVVADLHRRYREEYGQ
jgi:L-ribulose-5-phosphate 4-epimerase